MHKLFYAHQKKYGNIFPPLSLFYLSHRTYEQPYNTMGEDNLDYQI
jgi:hypothetical protein